MQGISVKNPDNKPYLTTGHQLYLIGGQNGMFPEAGAHIAYQMWGVWAPPIKVLNGFWFKLGDQWLTQADEFEVLPYGARFSYETQGLSIRRMQFVPHTAEGLIVSLTIKNNKTESKTIPITLGAVSNLMPTWLADRIGKLDGEDYTFTEKGAVIFKDSCNPWTALLGSDTAPDSVQFSPAVLPPQESHGNGTYAELLYFVSLSELEEITLHFYLASSSESMEAAVETFCFLKENRETLLEEKRQIYADRECRAALSYPSKPELENLYRWTQYINDWIVREVKHIGTGVAAGYAEFPWWFGNDTCYIIPALLMQGDTELCKSSLRLIKSHSEKTNQNGRVVHEISNNGVVFYEGMTTETPQFTDAVWEVYLWSGDRHFLREMFAFCKRGMEWVEANSENGLPTGYGISEIAGLNCICCDAVILAARGYEALSLIAEELGETETQEKYRKLHTHVLEQFQREFWIEDLGIYGDMLATKEEITARAESWKYSIRGFPISEEDKIMADSSTKTEKSPQDAEMKRRLVARMDQVLAQAALMNDTERRAFNLFNLGHSIDAIEYGYLSAEHAQAVIKQLDEKKEDQFEMCELMPIFFGRRARALGEARMPMELLHSIQIVADAFGAVTPGATSEIYPDSGCFVQAWNSYAAMWPYAHSIFGIHPNAARKTIRLTPCFCEEMDGLSLQNLRIGGDGFSFRYEYADGANKLFVHAPAGWEISLESSVADVQLIQE